MTKEAVAVLKKYISGKKNTEKVEISVLQLNRVIHALEQGSKTGRWVKYGIPRCGEQHYKCTSCGYYINFGKWGEIYTKKYKYCPNCGAKMIEQQESEE